MENPETGDPIAAIALNPDDRQLLQELTCDEYLCTISKTGYRVLCF